MRIALWMYGLVYLLIEVTGHQLESIGWPRLTPLDVAEAVVDAVFVVTVVVAVLFALRLGAQRWQRSMADWLAGQEPVCAGPAAPITVTSWRPEPLALPPGPLPRYPAPTGPLDGGAPYR